jgi:hypothetical protein
MLTTFPCVKGLVTANCNILTLVADIHIENPGFDLLV